VSTITPSVEHRAPLAPPPGPAFAPIYQQQDPVPSLAEAPPPSAEEPAPASGGIASSLRSLFGKACAAWRNAGCDKAAAPWWCAGGLLRRRAPRVLFCLFVGAGLAAGTLRAAKQAFGPASGPAFHRQVARDIKPAVDLVADDDPAPRATQQAARQASGLAFQAACDIKPAVDSLACEDPATAAVSALSASPSVLVLPAERPRVALVAAAAPRPPARRPADPPRIVRGVPGWVWVPIKYGIVWLIAYLAVAVPAYFERARAEKREQEWLQQRARNKITENQQRNEIKSKSEPQELAGPGWYLRNDLRLLEKKLFSYADGIGDSQNRPTRNSVPGGMIPGCSRTRASRMPME
jgi:hypothetical protein